MQRSTRANAEGPIEGDDLGDNRATLDSQVSEAPGRLSMSKGTCDESPLFGAVAEFAQARRGK